MKPHKGFMDAVRDEQRLDRIKDKHDLPENAVIIEKTNTLKFLLSFGKTFIKAAAAVLLIVLAGIGVITLLYPSLRAELLQIFGSVFSTIT